MNGKGRKRRRTDEDRRKIYVWYLETEALDDHNLGAALNLLSSEERARHDRFVFERDRRDFAAAHALARTTLSRYEVLSPHAWTFETGPHGKPFISSAPARPLSFNISHTHGLVACVVARGLEVGVDVERLDRHVEADLVATSYFAVSEVQDLHECRGAARVARFFELWTLKEAYVKATGCGLSHSLSAISFSFLRDARLAFMPRPQCQRDEYHFELFAPAPHYRLAVAVRHPHDVTIVAVNAQAPANPLPPVRSTR